MKVKDVMQTDAGFSAAAADSAMKVAELMRQRDSSAVPVCGEAGELLGVLTDRDLCLAIVARNRKASDIKAGDLIKGEPSVCASEDKIEDALRKMRKQQTERLAVVRAENGALVGVLSVADVLRAAGKNKDLKKKIYSTLRAIAKPRPIVLREVESKDESAGRTNEKRSSSD